MDYYNTRGCPQKKMAHISGEHWLEFKFTCGMVSMIHYGLETNAVEADRVPRQRQRYRGYMTAVKCIMRYVGSPVVVKHLILRNYHWRGGAGDELETELTQLADDIAHQRRHRIMTLLGRALATVNALEARVPREIGLEIASY